MKFRTFHLWYCINKVQFLNSTLNHLAPQRQYSIQFKTLNSIFSPFTDIDINIMLSAVQSYTT